MITAPFCTGWAITYGRAVNIASRIASMAMPNSILVTEPIAKAAADAGFKADAIGVRSLRGLPD